jgi:hypothetical protein
MQLTAFLNFAWGACDSLCCYCCCCVAAAGKQTVNTMFGTRVAVLAGDFLFAQASWLIANLENLEVGAQHCICVAAEQFTSDGLVTGNLKALLQTEGVMLSSVS